MASERIIFGREVSEPGNYRLCWVTSTEAGEIVQSVRNVVVSQHGPFFYMQFADAEFKPYPCGHEGLRCDLLDPNAAWLTVAEDIELQPDAILRRGDQVVHPIDGSLNEIGNQWEGHTVVELREQTQVDFKVVRSGRSRDNRNFDRTPGLQAAG